VYLGTFWKGFGAHVAIFMWLSSRPLQNSQMKFENKDLGTIGHHETPIEHIFKPSAAMNCLCSELSPLVRSLDARHCHEKSSCHFPGLCPERPARASHKPGPRAHITENPHLSDQWILTGMHYETTNPCGVDHYVSPKIDFCTAKQAHKYN
jgi:hypothetical protein